MLLLKNMTSSTTFDEAAVAEWVADLLAQAPAARVGVWGLIGRGERIINSCPSMKNNLVWLGDSNPALLADYIPASELPISRPALLGLADIDVLVIAIRMEYLDDVIATARKALKSGAYIVSLKGVEQIRHRDYEGASPQATYSPWGADDDFLREYSDIAPNTLVDVYRCYELWQLVGQAAKLQAGALLEVGVWRGGTGALIARCAKLNGLTDPVILCDTFTGVVKTGPLDSVYQGGEHHDCTKDDVIALIERLDLDNVEILEGTFPDESGTALSDQQFRFSHVDVDTYESTRGVVEWLWPRLVRGGIMVFDDYGFQTCDGVTVFVNEMRTWPGCHIVHNLNGHAVAVKF